jgi:hypothetical protein
VETSCEHCTGISGSINIAKSLSRGGAKLAASQQLPVDRNITCSIVKIVKRYYLIISVY